MAAASSIASRPLAAAVVVEARQALPKLRTCAFIRLPKDFRSQPQDRVVLGTRVMNCARASQSEGSAAVHVHEEQAAAATTPRLALISLSDKTGLEALGKGLTDLGFSLVSTGGTAASLQNAGCPVTQVDQLTSFPEMLDGRVKTLHPAVHGGILARRDVDSHMDALRQHGIGSIDIVVVNLYPFYGTVTASVNRSSFDESLEKIDIGGPAMIRAAAKNHRHVLVVVDPADYQDLLGYLQGQRTEPEERFRRRLAWKAFQHVASYDTAVAEWLWEHARTAEDTAPPSLTLPLDLKAELRYGENPHQKASLYADTSLASFGAGGIASATQHHGKEMSYNNYLDADAAWECVSEFTDPTCVVVKHTNPCGVASGSDLIVAYRDAVRADPVSAFGGIVAFNVEVDEKLASEIREFRSPTDGETRMFYEIVVAPKYTEEGLRVLKGKSKALRILEAQKSSKGRQVFRQVSGGWLRQDADELVPADIDFTLAGETFPTVDQVEDCKFAWLCVKHVKSNAIVLAKSKRMLGMGSGQPNRVKSVGIAVEKPGEEVKGSVLASDAFFPFAWNDAVEEACKAGVSAIVHPGGSVRDQDTIDCCNKYGVALLVTGVRHFRH